MSAPSQTAPSSVTPRALQLALFITGGLWLLAAMTIAGRAAQGIADRFNLPAAEPLMEQLFLLFLLLIGFTLLQGVTRRSGTLTSVNALPQRSTTGQEILRGAALGWAMLLIAVLPMMLTGALHLQFWVEPRAWGLAVLSVLTLAASTLALEVAFRGYLFQRLIAAFGQVTATLLLAALYTWFSSYRPSATGLSMIVTFVFAILLAMAYLRTHALWLGWGLHFGWAVATAVLFGLPLGGLTSFNQIVSTTVIGQDWLTGGNYGPEAALFTLFVVLAAMPMLFRITRDYAWNYTHAPIIPAGYAVVVAPPAAHTAMEAAAAPAPLVQILGATPTAPSTLPIIEEHLTSRSTSESTE